jgi:hypothetical protein
MNRHEAAIVSAYTGFLLGSFEEMQKYAEKTLNRPIFTHEFGDKKLAEELRMATYNDFIKLCKEITDD